MSVIVVIIIFIIVLHQTGKTALIHTAIHHKLNIAESIVNFKYGICCLYREADLNIQDQVSV